MLGKIIFIIVAIIVIVLICIIQSLYADAYDFRDWLTEEHGIPLFFGLLVTAIVLYLFIFVSWKIMLIITGCVVGIGLFALIIYGIVAAHTKEPAANTQKQYDELELLEKRIYKVSAKRFRDRYYSDSVEAAIKEIVARLKKLMKRYKNKEIKELDMFEVVFNDNPNETLLIAGDDLFSKSGKSEQEGYRFMLKGLWKALRDPNAHEDKPITKEQAFERLFFIGMLMRKIDECVKKSNLKE